MMKKKNDDELQYATVRAKQPQFPQGWPSELDIDCPHCVTG